MKLLATLYLLLISLPGMCSELQLDTIKIGLLIPDKKSVGAKHGAELAVKNANKDHSNSHYYILEVRDMEGPWGTGSKMMVDLVFNEKVWGVVGCVDGRNSHLAEQVSAKSQVIFLNALSGDPTLSKAFVPWYFSCVPNDIQNAIMMKEELLSRKTQGKIAVVTESGYDTEMASENFIKHAGTLDLIRYRIKQSQIDFKEIINDIRKSNPSSIVLFGGDETSAEFIEQLRNQNMSQDIFASLFSIEYPFKKELNDVYMISPEFFFNMNGMIFSKEFMKSFGYPPGLVSAYSFDSINLLIRAIESSKNDLEQLPQNLMAIKYEGITGEIRFDERGNRVGESGFMKIVDGKLVRVDKN